MKLSVSKKGIDYIRDQKFQKAKERLEKIQAEKKKNSLSKSPKKKKSIFRSKARGIHFKPPDNTEETPPKNLKPRRTKTTLDKNKNQLSLPSKIKSTIVHKRKRLKLSSLKTPIRFTAYFSKMQKDIEKHSSKIRSSSYEEFHDSFSHFKPITNFSKLRMKEVKNKAKEKKKLQKILGDMQMIIDGKVNWRKKVKKGKKSRKMHPDYIENYKKAEEELNVFSSAVKERKVDFKKYNNEIRKIQYVKKLEAIHQKSKSMHLMTSDHIKQIANERRFEILRIHPKPDIDTEVENLQKTFKRIVGIGKDFSNGHIKKGFDHEKNWKAQKRMEKLQRSTGHLRVRELKKEMSSRYGIDKNLLPKCFRYYRKGRNKKRRGGSLRM